MKNIQTPPSVALATVTLALTGCAASGATSSSPLCEQADAHVRECFGVGLDECNQSLAEDLLSQSCAQLEARATAKTDGFCPSFLWWLCGEDPGYECAEAGDPADYPEMTSQQRFEYHWAWVGCTAYGQENMPEISRRPLEVLTEVAAGLRTSALRLGRAFTNSTDELDSGRVKLLHPTGSVAGIELIRPERTGAESCPSDYTGMFAEERLVGLTRLSWAADPRAVDYIPGVALKFFVDGEESINLHTISSLSGTEDRNFFGQAVTNVLEEPESRPMRIVLWLFRRVADDPLRLRLEHMARRSSDGTEVAADAVVAPYQIDLRPTPEVAAMYQRELERDSGLDFREALTAIPSGTALYEVYVSDRDDCSQHLGTLRTTTEIVPSWWGDRRLHFPHAAEEQGFDD